jgi:hypothetical protein
MFPKSIGRFHDGKQLTGCLGNGFQIGKESAA